MGQLDVGGHGTIVVPAPGAPTEMGKLAAILQSVHADLSPLMQEVRSFSKLIATFACVVVLAIVAIVDARGLPFNDVLLFAMAETVSIIPEGLPAAGSLVPA